jgi:DICT domain-containing protein
VPPATTHARFTKSTLVILSHAIEQAALAAAEDGPMVVVALFQRMPYFERERPVYERIAQRAAVTVVGMVSDEVPEQIRGAYAVGLREQEPLAREWSVAVLTPRFGAVLVAHDREEIAPHAATMESGRLFDGWSRFRRDDALHEVLRLRTELADRLPAAALSAIDDVLQRVRHFPATPGEVRADAAARFFVEQNERHRAQTNSLRKELETARADPAESGLSSDQDVHRWSGAGGVTASGVLPVAVLGVRVIPLQSATDHRDRRIEAREAEQVIGVLTALLRREDRATRVADNEFILIMPAMSHDDALRMAYGIGSAFVAASEHNPFLSATATVALAETRRRPLPVAEIREALAWAVAEGEPVVTLTTD